MNFTNVFNPFVFIVVYSSQNWWRVKFFQNILVPFVSRGLYLRFTPKFHFCFCGYGFVLFLYCQVSLRYGVGAAVLHVSSFVLRLANQL